MAEQTINGTRMHYQFDGVEQRPVLLFSNSLGIDLTLSDEVVNTLRSPFRIQRYDTHGQTPASEGTISLDELGQDVLGLLDALYISSVYFCGLSMGGLIGQWLAVHHTEHSSKLGLCNTAAKIGTTETWNERIETARRQGIAAIADTALNRWFAPPLSPDKPRPDDQSANPTSGDFSRRVHSLLCGYSGC